MCKGIQPFAPVLRVIDTFISRGQSKRNAVRRA
jgi:hypothetical protein